MEKFVFNYKEKRVGCYLLDTSITLYLDHLIQLYRYDYENFDTFEIPNSDGSKLFAVDGQLKAIQCGKNFHLNGVNLIGISDAEALLLLGGEWETWHQGSEIEGYYCKDMKLRLYTLYGKIIWVIFHSYDFS